jgi:hypothetical protein
MGILKLLSTLFTPAAERPARYVMPLRAQCLRCGEILTGEINLANDLSAEFDDNGGTTYLCRKVLMGTQRCFQPVELTLTFNAARKLIDQQVTGGKLLPAEDAAGKPA